MSTAIGVDVGGGGVRAGVVGPQGLGGIVRAGLDDRSVSSVVEAVAEAVQGLSRPDGPVGVGVPGFVSGSVVRASPNFPTWHEVDLGAALTARLGRPVVVLNDANAATLGGHAALGGDLDLVQLTLGTGVGGGVVTGGHLLTGAGGTGAELGHLYVGGTRPCGCGGVGCLETWCGTVGLLAAARERGQAPADGAAVVAAARAGEAWAEDVLQQAGEALGRGLVSLVNLFNPDVVRITGGLAAAEDQLDPPARAWLSRHGIAPSVERVRVVWAGRAEHDAIVGAATAARYADAA